MDDCLQAPTAKVYWHCKLDTATTKSGISAFLMRVKAYDLSRIPCRKFLLSLIHGTINYRDAGHVAFDGAALIVSQAKL